MFLGIDIGTSSAKILLMESAGKVIATVSREYPVYYPQSGWAEQNPADWWRETAAGIREVIAKAGISGAEIKAAGLSGQMHGSVFVDKDGIALANAILWCDQRTVAECDEITAAIGQKRLVELTGNMALTGFTAPKILWARKQWPEVYARTARVLLPKDYIRFCLTGEYAAEVSDASGTLLFDVAQRDWSQEMLDRLEIARDWMPRCYESYEITGRVTPAVAECTGLTAGIPVCGGGGDQAAGAVGTGTVGSGALSVALGTSGVVFACLDNYACEPDGKLHAFCHANGKWHMMGVMLSAAAALKWWVEEVQNSRDYDGLIAEAFAIADSDEVPLFVPYLVGERTPHNDAVVRGAFIGLDITHNRAHLTRAVIEGITFGLRDSLELIRAAGMECCEARVSGGGAQSADWLQLIADVFELPVIVPNATEGGAYGAAILAAVAAGEYADIETACAACIRPERIVLPQGSGKYGQRYRRYRAVYPAINQL